MEFKLQRAKNGIILEMEDEKVVFQDTEQNEHEMFADFLRYLSDNYGPSDSRYSPARIYIRVAPGDKHESFNDENPPF